MYKQKDARKASPSAAGPMSVEASELARSVVLEGEQAFALDWHPTRSLLAVGLITGQLQLYSCAAYAPHSGEGAAGESARGEGGVPSKECSAKPHKGACRAARFGPAGDLLFSGGADRLLQMRDVSTNKPIWRQPRAHGAAINALATLESSGVATGDDEGQIKLWDLRQRDVAMTFSENDELITDLLFCETRGTTLAASSADCHLSILDLRKGRLLARSDPQEDELLSLSLVKRGKKVNKSPVPLLFPFPPPAIRDTPPVTRPDFLYMDSVFVLLFVPRYFPTHPFLPYIRAHSSHISPSNSFF